MLLGIHYRIEKEHRISGLTSVVSAKNAAKTLRRMSMSRIEGETLESIMNSEFFCKDSSEANV